MASDRAPIADVTAALQRIAQRLAPDMQDAVLDADSIAECAAADAINAEFDSALAKLGWTREELAAGLSRLPATRHDTV